MKDYSKFVGYNCEISGDLENGYNYVDNKPFIDKEFVTRFIKIVTDTHIICECGRKFTVYFKTSKK